MNEMIASVDWAMVIVCLLGVLTVTMYGLANIPKDPDISKLLVQGVGNYFMATWPNFFFHATSSLLLLSFVDQVGLEFVGFFIELPIEDSSSVHLVLSAMCGLGGGWIVAKIIRLFQKLN